MYSTEQSQFSSRRGFTLAELVFAAGISVFVVMVSLGLLMTMLKSEAENYNKISMDEEASSFLIAFTRDVQASGEVLTATADAIELELLRYSDTGSYSEFVGYYLRQVEGSEDYYILRSLEDVDGNVRQKEFFKLNGNNGAIGMISMQASIKDTTVKYSTSFYDAVREATDAADQVRFIRWEFPLHYEASTMTFSRKVTSPLVMLRNKTS